MRKDNENITIRSLILGIIFSALFAILTVVLENRQEMLPTGNQVALFPYIMLVFLVIFINPFFRLVRIIKPLSLAELLIIFVMCMVSSGISTFGLTGVGASGFGTSGPFWAHTRHDAHIRNSQTLFMIVTPVVCHPQKSP